MHAWVDRVLNLGVTPGKPLDFVVAVRATNAIAALMVVVSIGGIVMELTNEGRVEFALVIGVCMVAYLCVLLLDGSGFLDAARLALLIVACSHWTMLSVNLGPQSGVRFGIIPLILYPAIGFARVENQKARAAYIAIVVTFVVAQILTDRFGPLAQLSTAALERSNYFILVSVAVLCGLGLRYYQQSAVSARMSLDEANRRIAELLANVLPAPIAERLGEVTAVHLDLDPAIDAAQDARRLSPLVAHGKSPLETGVPRAWSARAPLASSPAGR